MFSGVGLQVGLGLRVRHIAKDRGSSRDSRSSLALVSVPCSPSAFPCGFTHPCFSPLPVLRPPLALRLLGSLLPRTTRSLLRSGPCGPGTYGFEATCCMASEEAEISSAITEVQLALERLRIATLRSPARASAADSTAERSLLSLPPRTRLLGLGLGIVLLLGFPLRPFPQALLCPALLLRLLSLIALSIAWSCVLGLPARNSF